MVSVPDLPLYASFVPVFSGVRLLLAHEPFCILCIFLTVSVSRFKRMFCCRSPGRSAHAHPRRISRESGAVVPDQRGHAGSATAEPGLLGVDPRVRGDPSPAAPTREEEGEENSGLSPEQETGETDHAASVPQELHSYARTGVRSVVKDVNFAATA